MRMTAKTGKYGTITKAALLRKVRKFCLWCCGGSFLEVSNCTSYDCQLWDIRSGDPHPEKRPEDFQPSWVLKELNGKTRKTGTEDE